MDLSDDQPPRFPPMGVTKNSTSKLLLISVEHSNRNLTMLVGLPFCRYAEAKPSLKTSRLLQEAGRYKRVMSAFCSRAGAQLVCAAWAMRQLRDGGRSQT
jgi:hypothetical protein